MLIELIWSSQQSLSSITIPINLQRTFLIISSVRLLTVRSLHELARTLWPPTHVLSWLIESRCMFCAHELFILISLTGHYIACYAKSEQLDSEMVMCSLPPRCRIADVGMTSEAARSETIQFKEIQVTFISQQHSKRES